MVWDPTFNWADATSFRGEARKYPILTEMIIQLNLKADIASESNMANVAKNNPLGPVIDFNSKFDSLVPLFIDQVAGDGSYWTVAKLETEIGASRPVNGLGYCFTPTWINWMYQAVSLLLSVTPPPSARTMDDDWGGVGYNTGSYADANFLYRWTAQNPDVGLWAVNNITNEINFSTGVDVTGAANYIDADYRTSADRDDNDITWQNVKAEVSVMYLTIQLRSVNIFVNLLDSVLLINGSSETFDSAYAEGTWRSVMVSGVGTLYFNGVEILTGISSVNTNIRLAAAIQPGESPNYAEITAGPVIVKDGSGDPIPI